MKGEIHMKVMKRLFSISFVFVLILSASIGCFAGEQSFLLRFVDSNQWSYITAATKDRNGTYGEIKVDAIYDADVSLDNNYSKVYAKATTDGTSTLVNRGEWVEVAIPSGYQSAGTEVKLYCMGHTPWLDCYINGLWNVH